jgi:branched-chain amino acid transport system ATP-binding protein
MSILAALDPQSAGTARRRRGDAPLLAATDLVVRYGAITALRGVNLEVSAGEVVTLLGANGAGKTTMLRAISGLVRPSAGTIRMNGAAIERLSPSRIVARGVAHCPEGRRIFASLSVADNLRLGATARRDRGAVEADRERMFELFPILKERLHQPGGTLSGGEQQMLALARAMMAAPRLLLLDEPSLGLAPLMVQKIFETLAALKRQGVTMLVVEQNASAALDLADRAYVLRTGEIILSDTAATLRQDRDRVAHAYLGATQ